MYLKILAQAIRCSLRDVFPVSNLSGTVRIQRLMVQYEAKPAVDIFVDWQAGEVGYSEGRRLSLPRTPVLSCKY